MWLARAGRRPRADNRAVAPAGDAGSVRTRRRSSSVREAGGEGKPATIRVALWDPPSRVLAIAPPASSQKTTVGRTESMGLYRLPALAGRGVAVSDKSGIEWTNATWNPVTGCTKVSEGCRHCYAERFAERFRGVKGHPFENGFDLTLRPERLGLPLKWKDPRLIFVNSMSDLFHERVPIEFIQRVFDTMRRAEHHTFQILTKRAKRLEDLASSLTWPGNVWMGVSVEDMRVAERVDRLRAVPARIRFLSCEPLIGSLRTLDLSGIHWVIVGGESGPGARPMKARWVSEIQENCRVTHVPFFFKQWGGPVKSRTGRELDGRTYDELPASDVRREGAVA